MFDVSHLLAVADAYQRLDPIEDKTLSFRVFGDSKKLTALRSGSDLTTARFNAAMSWFLDNWPDGAPRPDIFGPTPKREGEAAA